MNRFDEKSGYTRPDGRITKSTYGGNTTPRIYLASDVAMMILASQDEQQRTIDALVAALREIARATTFGPHNKVEAERVNKLVLIARDALAAVEAA